MSEKLDVKILDTLLSTHFGRGERTFTPTPTGHFSSTYFVDSADRKLVLRIAPPDNAGFLFYEKKMMLQEPGIHRLLLERTTVPVPEILAFDDTRKLIDRDFLIMERLPGIPASQVKVMDPTVWDKVLFKIGYYLRQTHEITADSYGYLGAHHPMEPQDTWEKAFRVMWDNLIDDVHETGYYDSDEATCMKELLTRYQHHFQRHVPSSLLHMDIWSQNILVEGPEVTGIIDWDRACWGDVEMEFAILDYCRISEPAFWRGYGLERDTSEPARIRRLFYLLYEVQKYMVIYHWRESDPKTCLRYKRQSMELAGSL